MEGSLAHLVAAHWRAHNGLHSKEPGNATPGGHCGCEGRRDRVEVDAGHARQLLCFGRRQQRELQGDWVGKKSPADTIQGTFSCHLGNIQ
jgi:hypothetical protein